MASLDSGGDGGGGGHKKGPGVKKAKKLSTRVDMTPMVDLGFLLITFFIFTATMNEPTAMDLNMPKDTDKEDEQTKTKQSGALTVMLGKDNKVYYYEGELTNENASQIFQQTTYKGIREEIIKKKNSVIAAYRTDAACEEKAKKEGKKVSDCKQQDFFVVIKPDPESTYKNAVDMLDEMTINDVKRYALMKISDTEKQLIGASENQGGAK
jgi:biopolymer transport protein ExbD